MKHQTFFRVLLLLWAATAHVWAINYTPTILSDPAVTGGVNSANGVITGGAGNGQVSLRSAVIAANATGGANTIILGAGTYQLTIAGTGETAASGDATIGDLDVLAPASGRNTLTVQGAGAGSTTIQQTSGIDRIFDAHPVNLAGSVTLILSDVTLKGGNLTSSSGGAILAGRPGDVTTLINCVCDGNTATSNGGAISASSGGASHDLNITNCVFRNNTATAAVGGAVNYSGIGTVNIANTVFSNNVAGTQGGAVNVSGTGSGGTYNIFTSTFLNNTANGNAFGGAAIAIVNGVELKVNFNRFSGNIAGAVGNGKVISTGGGVVTTFDVNRNWWGVNTGPLASDVLGTVPAIWLQLRNSASPATVTVGNTSTVSADIFGLNTGAATASGNLTGLAAFPSSGTVFGNVQRGTIPGGNIQFINGAATVVLTATTLGAGGVDAVADSQTVTASITIPTGVASINRVQTSPTNLNSVQWTVTFSNAVSGVAAGNFSLVNTGLGGVPAITSVTAVGGAPATSWTVTASTGSGSGTLGLNMANGTGVSASIVNLPFTGQVYTIDLIAPTVTCSTNIVITANGYCPAVVNYIVSASDNLALSLATTNPASGSAFAVGTNTVTLGARDTADNTNFCTFKVIVLPGSAPQLALVPSGTNVVLSWPSAFTCYALHYTPALLPPPAANVWTLHPGPFTTNAGTVFVTNSIGATNRFFRLFF